MKKGFLRSGTTDLRKKDVVVLCYKRMVRYEARNISLSQARIENSRLDLVMDDSHGSQFFK